MLFLKKWLPLLMVLTLAYTARSQSKRIFTLDSSYLKSTSILYSSKLEENPTSGEVFATGRFVAYDSLGIPHQPFFIQNTTNSIKDIISIYPNHTFTFITRQECDLTSWYEVSNYFARNPFDYIIHLAAKVGGLFKNLDSNI